MRKRSRHNNQADEKSGQWEPEMLYQPEASESKNYISIFYYSPTLQCRYYLGYTIEEVDQQNKRIAFATDVDEKVLVVPIEEREKVSDFFKAMAYEAEADVAERHMEMEKVQAGKMKKSQSLISSTTNELSILRNKHMTTPNNENQKAQLPQVTEAREMLHWKVGSDIVTFYGADQNAPVAYVKLERYNEHKKPVLSSRDAEGNVLFPETSNLYELKKAIRDKSREPITQDQENTQVQAEVKTVTITATAHEEKPPVEDKSAALKNTRRKSKSKAKENDQTITH